MAVKVLGSIQPVASPNGQCFLTTQRGPREECKASKVYDSCKSSISEAPASPTAKACAEPMSVSETREVAQAYFKLGEMYYKGEGVGRNYQEASKLLKVAAEGGNAGAQYRLAIMHNDGLVAQPNKAEGLKWLNKA